MAPSPQPENRLIQMADITKRYPGGVTANDSVSLAASEGTIHAVIGENGAGKSTLMGILFGRVQPDSGTIRLRGEQVRIENPAKAISLGIGMVTQHTTMIPALSAVDNVILGAEPTSGGLLDRQKALASVQELGERLGIEVDWSARAETLSVAALQKAEIVKALYRGARILILDEPTATLAPQEAEGLFKLLHSLADSGATILFVTHKLREVMAHSSHVTVLRGGKLAGARATAETNPAELLALMLGRDASAAEPGRDAACCVPSTSQPSGTQPMGTQQAASLRLESVRVLDSRRAAAVRDVSLCIAPGEIVGVAGVDGSGQRELAEAIVGTRPLAGGQIILNGDDISRLNVAGRLQRGIAYVPEDRHREGLVLSFTIAENMLLGRQRDRVFGGGAVLNLPRIAKLGDEAVRAHRIRATGGSSPAAALSGGNQQKVVIARALEGKPKLLVAMTPTRGLDVEATRFVYESIRAARAEGLATLLFSLDLDEIFEISDRIAVMYNGSIAGVVERSLATPEDIGRMMVEGHA